MKRTKVAAFRAGDSTLARIDAPAPAPPVHAPPPHPVLPEGVPWPASLRRCRVSGWRWMGQGLRCARVDLPHYRAASL
ncbi:MAG TPA: hypothetical protein VMH32_13745 [Burkholderiales bacterium]|nr:hypothetical protein [Burkholderiales bacterium]